MGKCSSRNLFPEEDCRDLVVALFTSSYRTWIEAYPFDFKIKK